MKLADRFQSPILCILSILVGLTLGWWLRDSRARLDQFEWLESRTEQPVDHTIVLSTTEPLLDEIKINHSKIRSEFLQALNSERLDDALVIYQHHEQFHSDICPEFHGELMNKFHQYHHQKNAASAISILELFTQPYYQNIELLNTLAASYMATNQLANALEVYAGARSYCYKKEDIRSFDQQIHQIAHALFEKNHGLPSLERFIPLFLKLSYLEPDYGFYRLVLAKGYLMQNDVESTESAIRELLILQMDQGFNETASQLLASLIPEIPPEALSEGEKTIVPISKIRGQLVVNAIAGDRLKTRLLIDTGASLTSLPHHTLEALKQQNQARKIGQIDLTTASGIHRTPLYRLDQLKIGDFFVSNLETAEFGPINQEIDGVLGMNVLNHFNFFIDQNLHQLSLTPRQME